MSKRAVFLGSTLFPCLGSYASSSSLVSFGLSASLDSGWALSFSGAIGAGPRHASIHKQARNNVDAQGEDHRIEGKGEEAVQQGQTANRA